MRARFADTDLVPSSRPGHHGSTLRMSGLYCYPVKGCAPVALTDSVLTRAGLQHDRSFMVVSEGGTYRTQRTHPALALIRPEISAEGTVLVLNSPAAGAVNITVDATGRRGDVDLFGVGYQGIDQGNTVAEWLSDTLGERSRLVGVPPEHNRLTDGQTPGTSGYADSCPVHIVSQASLDLLNHTLASNGSAPLPMDRFRPNIVLTGNEEPHIEDRLHRIRIGEAELGYAKPAMRCVVTTVDQALGTKSGPEPLTTLATYRRTPEGTIAFGTKFAVTTPSTITVNDPVTVDTWRTPEA